MKRIQLILLGLFLVVFNKLSIAQNIENVTCKEGEKYYECSSACEPNCDNYLDIACIEICMPPKCQCKEGYVKNKYNVCIPRDDCPKETTIEPILTTSLNYPIDQTKAPIPLLPPLPNFCCNPLLPCQKCPFGQHCIGLPGNRHCVPIVCNLLCRYGFVCKIINGKPTCIPKCKQGEEYKECASACEPKCGQEPPRFCILICLSPRCQCKLGYARTACGNCVPFDECPCGKGEELSPCPVCEPTCSNKNPKCPLGLCSLNNKRCYCKPGYARIEKGLCIPIDQCPKESTTKILTTQLPPCTLTCDYGFECKIIDGKPKCISKCNINCGIYYQCKIIDGEAKCVPPSYLSETTSKH